MRTCVNTILNLLVLILRKEEDTIISNGVKAIDRGKEKSKDKPFSFCDI